MFLTKLLDLLCGACILSSVFVSLVSAETEAGCVCVCMRLIGTFVYMYSCDPPTHDHTASFFFFFLLAVPLGSQQSPLFAPFGLLCLSMQTPYRIVVLFRHVSSYSHSPHNFSGSEISFRSRREFLNL